VTSRAEAGRLGAVVLTGGTASRLGGRDKAALEVGGVTLLERALDAVRIADDTVVVGAPVPTSRPVTWTREDPPSGGPGAGLLAGLDALTGTPQLVVVLAVDMPRVTSMTVDRLLGTLLDALSGASWDGVVLVDRTGRRQTLAAVYRVGALLAARPADRSSEPGLPVRRLVAGLRLLDVPEVGDESHDVDTPDDLEAVRGPDFPIG